MIQYTTCVFTIDAQQYTTVYIILVFNTVSVYSIYLQYTAGY